MADESASPLPAHNPAPQRPLTPAEIEELARKVYRLFQRDAMRLQERRGRSAESWR